MSRQASDMDYGMQDYLKMSPEEKILFRSSTFRVVEGLGTEAALESLKERISRKADTGQDVMVTGTRTIIFVWSVAAVVVLLIGLRLIFSIADQTKINTGKGAHSDLILADGSAVKINACSRISFNKRKFTGDRRLTLDGEAFFDVTKGNSFVVSTPNGTVSVMGTSFNVYSRDSDFRVACLSGKVMVTSDNQSVMLEPGESAGLSSGSLRKMQGDKTKYIIGWINGEFYFENTPLDIVFSEIERQFNVKFAGGETANEFFTGSFANNDLKSALEIVCIPMGLEYEINDKGKISVSHKNH